MHPTRGSTTIRVPLGNDECPNDERGAAGRPLDIRTSSFFRHSSFGFRQFLIIRDRAPGAAARTGVAASRASASTGRKIPRKPVQKSRRVAILSPVVARTFLK